MKKKLVSILLVAAMVISLVACGDNNGSSSGKKNDGPFIINVCIASEPETIDPGLISSVDGSTYTQHQFEGLSITSPRAGAAMSAANQLSIMEIATTWNIELRNSPA